MLSVTLSHDVSKSFIVDVIYDDEASVYVAQCDELGLVTEAKSIDALVSRVKDIAPELAELNGVCGTNFNLVFTHEEVVHG